MNIIKHCNSHYLTKSFCYNTSWNTYQHTRIFHNLGNGMLCNFLYISGIHITLFCWFWLLFCYKYTKKTLLCQLPYCILICITTYHLWHLEYLYYNKPCTKSTLISDDPPCCLYFVSMLQLHSTLSHLVIDRGASYATYSSTKYFCITWSSLSTSPMCLLTVSNTKRPWPLFILTGCVSTLLNAEITTTVFSSLHLIADKLVELIQIHPQNDKSQLWIRLSADYA